MMCTNISFHLTFALLVGGYLEGARGENSADGHLTPESVVEIFNAVVWELEKAADASGKQVHVVRDKTVLRDGYGPQLPNLTACRFICRERIKWGMRGVWAPSRAIWGKMSFFVRETERAVVGTVIE